MIFPTQLQIRRSFILTVQNSFNFLPKPHENNLSTVLVAALALLVKPSLDMQNEVSELQGCKDRDARRIYSIKLPSDVTLNNLK